MKGKIVAANRSLGLLVVDTGDQGCIVLDVVGQSDTAVGDEVRGEWTASNVITAHNLTQGHDIRVRVQQSGASRSEAIGAVTVF